MNRTEIENIIAEYPVYQYAFVKPEAVPFSEKVRMICKNECERYGKSWSCPPAVGAVEECQKRCHTYENVLVFSTVAEAADTYDFSSRLATKKEHEYITSEIESKMKKNGYCVLTLSSDSCAICEQCAYPHEKCRHPEQMHPCIESYSIVITPLLEQLEFDYYISENLILWFSIIFFS